MVAGSIPAGRTLTRDYVLIHTGAIMPVTRRLLLEDAAGKAGSSGGTSRQGTRPIPRVDRLPDGLARSLAQRCCGPAAATARAGARARAAQGRARPPAAGLRCAARRAR